jgi:hypothetical protein
MSPMGRRVAHQLPPGRASRARHRRARLQYRRRAYTVRPSGYACEYLTTSWLCNPRVCDRWSHPRKEVLDSAGDDRREDPRSLSPGASPHSVSGPAQPRQGPRRRHRRLPRARTGAGSIQASSLPRAACAAQQPISRGNVWTFRCTRLAVELKTSALLSLLAEPCAKTVELHSIFPGGAAKVPA